MKKIILLLILPCFFGCFSFALDISELEIEHFEPVQDFNQYNIQADLKLQEYGCPQYNQSLAPVCAVTTLANILAFNILRNKDSFDLTRILKGSNEDRFIGIKSPVVALWKIRQAGKLPLISQDIEPFNNIARYYGPLNRAYDEGRAKVDVDITNISLILPETKKDIKVSFNLYKGFEDNFIKFLDAIYENSEPIWTEVPSFNIYVYRINRQSHEIDGASASEFMLKILLERKQPLILSSGNHGIIVEGVAIGPNGEVALKILNSWGKKYSGWFKEGPLLANAQAVCFIDELGEADKIKEYVIGSDGILGTISTKDVAAIKSYINNHPEILIQKSAQALILAVEYESLDILKILLDAGARVGASFESETAFWRACQNGNLAVVQLFFERGADIEKAVDKGITPLMIAAEGGQDAIVEYLIKIGAQIDTVSSDGLTAVYLASQNGNAHILSLLLKAGANPNMATTEKGTTPLMTAIASDKYDIVDILLASDKIEIDKQDTSLKTPLMLAALTRDIYFINKLLALGANVHLTDSMGFTALHMAAQEGAPGIIKMLINANAHVDAQTKTGNTPVHIALHFGYIGIVDDILSAHKDHSIMQRANQDGTTPLGQLIALENSTRKDPSPLFLAANYNFIHIARVMMKSRKEFDLNKVMKTTDGYFITVFDLARMKGHMELLNILRQ